MGDEFLVDARFVVIAFKPTGADKSAEGVVASLVFCEEDEVVATRVFLEGAESHGASCAIGFDTYDGCEEGGLKLLQLLLEFGDGVRRGVGVGEVLLKLFDLLVNAAVDRVGTIEEFLDAIHHPVVGEGK